MLTLGGARTCPSQKGSFCLHFSAFASPSRNQIQFNLYIHSTPALPSSPPRDSPPNWTEQLKKSIQTLVFFWPIAWTHTHTHSFNSSRLYIIWPFWHSKNDEQWNLDLLRYWAGDRHSNKNDKLSDAIERYKEKVEWRADTGVCVVGLFNFRLFNGRSFNCILSSDCHNSSRSGNSFSVLLPGVHTFAFRFGNDLIAQVCVCSTCPFGLSVDACTCSLPNHLLFVITHFCTHTHSHTHRRLGREVGHLLNVELLRWTTGDR